ncbi:unnamed protein product [Protopolystoma xenopodis]|uniref:Tektin n=1 Tax=Protopolystoma xenopodis TaxID=117903 RepID=A0A448X3M1_9PLAT|nr:unnamed protein product [Protopolystoma xenopodis]
MSLLTSLGNPSSYQKAELKPEDLITACNFNQEIRRLEASVNTRATTLQQMGEMITRLQRDLLSTKLECKRLVYELSESNRTSSMAISAANRRASMAEARVRDLGRKTCQLRRELKEAVAVALATNRTQGTSWACTEWSQLRNKYLEASSSCSQISSYRVCDRASSPIFAKRNQPVV